MILYGPCANLLLVKLRAQSIDAVGLYNILYFNILTPLILYNTLRRTGNKKKQKMYNNMMLGVFDVRDNVTRVFERIFHRGIPQHLIFSKNAI